MRPGLVLTTTLGLICSCSDSPTPPAASTTGDSPTDDGDDQGSGLNDGVTRGSTAGRGSSTGLNDSTSGDLSAGSSTTRDAGESFTGRDSTTDTTTASNDGISGDTTTGDDSVRCPDACVGGDGCCPWGCDAAEDFDCDPQCGNGVVEPGETCDGAAHCSSLCTDGDSCTYDNSMGSPETCDVMCLNDPISNCVDDDNCCPAGCDYYTNDDDCPARESFDLSFTGCDPDFGTTPHFVLHSTYLIINAQTKETATTLATYFDELDAPFDDTLGEYPVVNDDSMWVALNVPGPGFQEVTQYSSRHPQTGGTILVPSVINNPDGLDLLTIEFNGVRLYAPDGQECRVDGSVQIATSWNGN